MFVITENIVKRPVFREKACKHVKKKEMGQRTELERTYYSVHSNIAGYQLNAQ
jgi:hypothetical protein